MITRNRPDAGCREPARERTLASDALARLPDLAMTSDAYASAGFSYIASRLFQLAVKPGDAR
jgi:hypothetical protein